jgi:sugar phosphate permease
VLSDLPKAVGLPSPRELEGHAAHPPHHGHWFDGILVVARNRHTWPGFFLNLGMAGSLFAFAGLWAIPYLTQTHGWSRELAAQHSTVLLAAFAVGSFMIGAGSDRIGYRKPVILAACAVYVLTWLPLALGWKLTPGTSHALFFVMGLGASGFTLSWAAAKEVNRHALAGTATSLVNTGAFLGAAILQPLTGWVIERHGMAAGIQLLAAAALFGTLAAFTLKETRCRYLGVI